MGAIAKSDVELVEASRRGEQEAFGHLVERYQDVVCAVSYSSTGDAVLSEDVAQDTFIAAWSQLDRLRDTARLRPWLCGIARNLARNARKRRRREEPADLDEQVATGASPFEATARNEAERVVREALARVPAAYREVLVLYYRESQSIREVAATLETSEASAMQRLSRARRYLADSVHDLVERSLQDRRPRRDLVAAVIAAIAAITVAPRVDASPTKGSTMMKFAVAASAAAAVGVTAYVVVHNRSSDSPAPVTAPAPAADALHYGGGHLGLAHAPTLGPTAAARAMPSRSVAAADLSILPADSDAIIGLNFAQLRQSALWQRFVAPKLSSFTGTHEFESRCGFDPLASLSSISLGLKGMSHDDVTGVLIVHGFEKTKAMSCFERESVPHAEAHGSTVKIDGDVVLISHPSGDGTKNAAFMFSDATTAVVVIGPEAATRQGVERVAAGNPGSTPTAFAESLRYVNTDASFWFMVADGSPLVNLINGHLADKHAPIKLGTSYASIQITDTLAIDAGLRLGNPDAVAHVVSAIQSRMADPEMRANVSQHFDQFDVTADGSDLIVSVALTGDQLVGLATSMMMHSSVHASVQTSSN